MKIHTAMLLLAILSLFSCEREHLIPNEEELITTLIYSLDRGSGAEPLQFIFRDLDGDGGLDPVITADTLVTGITYFGTIVLLNETESPSEDITLEVEAEGDAHMFFYSGTAAEFNTIEYADTDVNGKPIGIQTTFTALQPGNHVLTITLRHNPDKNIPDPTLANAGGETDIEVSFPIVIQ